MKPAFGLRSTLCAIYPDYERRYRLFRRAETILTADQPAIEDVC